VGTAWERIRADPREAAAGLGFRPAAYLILVLMTRLPRASSAILRARESKGWTFLADSATSPRIPGNCGNDVGTIKLTKTLVEGAAPKARRFRLNDSLVPGLCLLVLPTGHRTWYVRHRVDGRQRELKLGTPTELSVDDARRLARDALARVREGGDPVEERKQRREAPTGQDLYERHRLARRGRPGWVTEEHVWRGHLLPAFGRVQVSRITTPMVQAFYDSAGRRPVARAAVLQLGRAIRMSERWGWWPDGRAPRPCLGVDLDARVPRERYLTGDELRRLRDALQAWEGEGPGPRWRFVQLIRLLLLTGCRLREILHARWAWVDWVGGRLIVPAEHHKTGRRTGRVRRVLLVPRSLEILEELRRQHPSDGGEWVIAGGRPGQPLNGYHTFWKALRDEVGLVDCRPHDLRHTFASYGLSAGHGLDVIGQLLGHTSLQSTRRYAHLIEDAGRAAAARVSDDLGM
jgi:integrase